MIKCTSDSVTVTMDPSPSLSDNETSKIHIFWFLSRRIFASGLTVVTSENDQDSSLSVHGGLSCRPTNSNSVFGTNAKRHSCQLYGWRRRTPRILCRAEQLHRAIACNRVHSVSRARTFRKGSFSYYNMPNKCIVVVCEVTGMESISTNSNAPPRSPKISVGLLSLPTSTEESKWIDILEVLSVQRTY